MSDFENLYGIESLKKVVKFPINFGMAIQNAMEDDDKISVAEWLGIAPGSLVNLVTAITNFKEAGKEYKDITEDERQELIDYVKDEYESDNDAVEALIEKCFKWIVLTDEIAHDFMAIKKSKQNDE